MGNLKEKIGLMLRTLGTKLSNDYGSADSTFIQLHDNDLIPKGAMNLTNLAQVLGAMICTSIDENDERNPTDSQALLIEFNNRIRFLVSYWGREPTFLKFQKFVYTEGWSDWHDISFT